MADTFYLLRNHTDYNDEFSRDVRMNNAISHLLNRRMQNKPRLDVHDILRYDLSMPIVKFKENATSKFIS